MTRQTEAQHMVLRLSKITKRFGKVVANDAVSLDLARGEVVALLGENGAGKTTLMNILFGQYAADEGFVEVFGHRLPPGSPRAALEAGVGMVHQHFTLAENLTVWENITLGTMPLFGRSLAARGAKARIRDLAADFKLAVDPDALVSDLTVGERQRVEILKALYRDARILILDEPTAVLTPQEADGLFATLRKAVEQGLSVVFISHKLHEVMAIADRVVVLRHGRLAATRKTAETTREELASLMVIGATQSPEFATRPAGPALMTLTGVGTGTDMGGVPLRDVTMTLHGGQITGLAGVSGNGQAALSDLVAGLLAPTAGQMQLAEVQVANWSPRQALAHGIARIPEDRHKTGTIADFDLTENAMLEQYNTEFAHRGWINWRKARVHAERLIDTYDIRCPGPDTRIRLLSGGNMQKLILGRALETDPTIILANQPVRGLDIGAVNYVHTRLGEARDRGAAVLLISEDLDEIMKLSDVIHVISEGRLSPGFARGSIDAAGLGAWMAGDGFAEATHAS
ncbi:ATP-binding cassette domain-containing protein [Epibacterium sp. SM1979]|uniref:ATP-binding cassette domain-containing protein n=1 Tax=Tritonibacter litoralis TaxID=2662264 RepID=A0A843YMS0_9RHOB|nr:ABC transporter ATP-binding protein [Tritonibacter litoralis]MQQ10714.1 ATP-binding cassette domain-containing protein [Tritonibacter litoralis]